MILRPFEYVQCRSVGEAAAALSHHGPSARVIAGGTALIPLMKHQLIRPAVLVSITDIPDLTGIASDGDGGLRVGAATTHWDVAHSPLVREKAPLLADACGRVASPTIRSMGTLGGNLCYGESASDPSPALLALRARLRLAGPAGERVVPLDRFFTGLYETALGPEEILTSVEVPALPGGARWRYLKWVPRAREDKALVGIAAVLVLDGPLCRVARLALGGVAASPIALRQTEAYLEGGVLDPRRIAEAAEAAAAEIEPLQDLQGSAQYKREMVNVWVRRVIGDLMTRGGAA